MVVREVPSHSTVVGVPGRVVKLRGKKFEELDHSYLPDPLMRRLENLGKRIGPECGSLFPGK